MWGMRATLILFLVLGGTEQGFHVRYGTSASPDFIVDTAGVGSVIFGFAYTFSMLWLIGMFVWAFMPPCQVPSSSPASLVHPLRTLDFVSSCLSLGVTPLCTEPDFSPFISIPSPCCGKYTMKPPWWVVFFPFPCARIAVAIVSGSIIDNLGNLRDMRSRIADDLEQSCFICNM